MGEDELVVIRKYICNHFQQRRYTQKRLDILNGFELVLIRCLNCHKVLTLEAKRIKKTRKKINDKNKLKLRFMNLFKKIKFFINKMIDKLLFSMKNFLQ